MITRNERAAVDVREPPPSWRAADGSLDGVLLTEAALIFALACVWRRRSAREAAPSAAGRWAGVALALSAGLAGLIVLTWPHPNLAGLALGVFVAASLYARSVRRGRRRAPPGGLWL